MAEFRSLPLFTDAYLADAGHLSDAEHGRYLLLLMHMWRSPECRLPNDDEWLAKRFHRSVAQVQEELRPVIAEFMQTDGNWIFQKRLKKEFDYCKEVSKKNSDAAKSKWKKKKDICQTDAAPHQSGNAPNPNLYHNKKDGADAPPKAVSGGTGESGNEKKRFFDLVYEILGETSGGLGVKLLRAKGDDLALASAALYQAKASARPRDYVGRIVAGYRDPSLPEVIPR